MTDERVRFPPKRFVVKALKVRKTARIRFDAIKYHTCPKIPNGKVTEAFKYSLLLLQSDYNASVRDCEEHILKGKDKEGFSVRYINHKIGKGVFTTKDFRHGDFLLEYPGELISIEEARKREKRYPPKFGSFLFFFNIKKVQVCIDATFSKRKGKYINDGFGGTQNAEAKFVKVGGKNHIAIFATRNIKSGEQVLYDYGVPSLPWRKKVMNLCKEKDVKSGQKKAKETHPGALTEVVREQLNNPNIEQADILPERSQSEISTSSVEHDPQLEKDLLNTDADCDLKEDKSKLQTQSTAHKSALTEVVREQLNNPNIEQADILPERSQSEISTSSVEHDTQLEKDLLNTDADCDLKEDKSKLQTQSTAHKSALADVVREQLNNPNIEQADILPERSQSEISTSSVEHDPQLEKDLLNTDADCDLKEDKISSETQSSAHKKNGGGVVIDEPFVGGDVEVLTADIIIISTETTEENGGGVVFHEPFVVDDTEVLTAVPIILSTETTKGALTYEKFEQLNDPNTELADVLSERPQSEISTSSVDHDPQLEKDLLNTDADCDLREYKNSSETQSTDHKSALTYEKFEQLNDPNTELADVLSERPQSEISTSSVDHDPQLEKDLLNTDADCDLREYKNSSETQSTDHKSELTNVVCEQLINPNTELGDILSERSQSKISTSSVEHDPQPEKDLLNTDADCDLRENKNSPEAHITAHKSALTEVVREQLNNPNIEQADILPERSQSEISTSSVEHDPQLEKDLLNTDADCDLKEDKSKLQTQSTAHKSALTEVVREQLNNPNIEQADILPERSQSEISTSSVEHDPQLEKDLLNTDADCDLKEDKSKLQTQSTAHKSALTEVVREQLNNPNIEQADILPERSQSEISTSSVEHDPQLEKDLLNTDADCDLKEDKSKLQTQSTAHKSALTEVVREQLNNPNIEQADILPERSQSEISTSSVEHDPQLEKDLLNTDADCDLKEDKSKLQTQSTAHKSALTEVVREQLNNPNIEQADILPERSQSEISTSSVEHDPQLEKDLLNTDADCDLKEDKSKLQTQSTAHKSALTEVVREQLNNPNIEQADILPERSQSEISTSSVEHDPQLEKDLLNTDADCDLKEDKSKLQTQSTAHKSALTEVVREQLNNPNIEQADILPERSQSEISTSSVEHDPQLEKDLLNTDADCDLKEDKSKLQTQSTAHKSALTEVVREQLNNPNIEQADILPERPQSEISTSSVEHDPQLEKDLLNTDADCDLKEDKSKLQTQSTAHKSALTEVVCEQLNNPNIEQADILPERSQSEISMSSVDHDPQLEKDLLNTDADCDLKGDKSKLQTQSTAHKSALTEVVREQLNNPNIEQADILPKRSQSEISTSSVEHDPQLEKDLLNTDADCDLKEDKSKLQTQSTAHKSALTDVVQEQLNNPNIDQSDILPERSQSKISTSSVEHDPQLEKDLLNTDADCDLKEDKISSETQSSAHKKNGGGVVIDEPFVGGDVEVLAADIIIISTETTEENGGGVVFHEPFVVDDTEVLTDVPIILSMEITKGALTYEKFEQLNDPNTELADVLSERPQSEISTSSVDHDPQLEKDLLNTDADCDLREYKNSSETQSADHKSALTYEKFEQLNDPNTELADVLSERPQSEISTSSVDHDPQLEKDLLNTDADCDLREYKNSSETQSADHKSALTYEKFEQLNDPNTELADVLSERPQSEISTSSVDHDPQLEKDLLNTDADCDLREYKNSSETQSADHKSALTYEKFEQLNDPNTELADVLSERPQSEISTSSVDHDPQLEKDLLNTDADCDLREYKNSSETQSADHKSALTYEKFDQLNDPNTELADVLSERPQSEISTSSVDHDPQLEKDLLNTDADCDLREYKNSSETQSADHKSELTNVVCEQLINPNTELGDILSERSQSKISTSSVEHDPQPEKDLLNTDADCDLRENKNSPEAHITAHKNITRGTNQKDQKKKPHRPCPFCHAFKSALSDHIKRCHSQEEVVKRALTLPKTSRIRAFQQFKREGIMKANMQRVKEKKKKSENVHMLRERKHNSTKGGKLIYCSKCFGFICSKYFSQHRKKCMSTDATSTLPQSMPTELFCEPGENADYQREILRTFRLDEIGQLCIADKLIVGFGNREYKTIRNHQDKKEERRTTLKNGMRRLGNLYARFKVICQDQSVETSSSIDMFKRNNFKILEDTIYKLTTDDDGKVKNGLKLGFGYILRKVCKYLHGEFLINGEDAEALEIDRFSAVLNYHWSTLFGDAEYATVLQRQTVLRKPHNLPSEKDIKVLRDFTTQKIQELVADEYIFIASSEYSLLRDLVVSRLTFFNARRGGEPSRMLLQEWEDALCNVWYKDTESVNDPLEKMLVGRFKLAYQSGKRVKLVPLLIVNDCWKAMEILTDPEIRKQANVYLENKFVFPLTRFSTGHVFGWQAVEKCCHLAGLDNSITATSMRHYVATVYAGLEVSDEERKRFYDHMGHTEAINKDVYQSPLAIKEVTQVGRFLHQLDRGVINERQKSNTEQIDSIPSEIPSTSSCTDEVLQTMDADCHLRNDANRLEKLYIAHNGVINERQKSNTEQIDSIPSEIPSTSSCPDEVLQTMDADCHLRNDANRLEKLYIAHNGSCKIILRNLKLSRNVIRTPSAPLNLNATCFPAEILLSWEEPKDNGGLQVTGYTVMMKDDYMIWHEIARLEKNVYKYTVENLNPEKSYYFAVHAANLVGKGPPAGLNATVLLTRKSEKRIYRHWSDEDTSVIYKYFQRFIENIGAYSNNKGPLPGVKELKTFTEKHPDVLKGVPLDIKISRIKSKIFNDRKELRRKMGVMEEKI